MKQRLINYYTGYLSDSLRRNSAFLILAQVVSTAAGFVFWILCSHLFQSSQIGLSAALMGFGALAATLTNLGLPNTILRFLPTSKQRGGLFAATGLLLLAGSIGGGLLALATIGVFAPKLGFVQSSAFLSILFPVLVLFIGLSSLVDSVLLAFRKGRQILAKATIVSLLRLVLPFAAAGHGVDGIIAIFTATFGIGIAYGLVIILRELLRSESFKPDFTEITSHRSYAASNYLGGMLGALPGTLIPIVILDELGAGPAAYFFMAMQIASFLSMLSSSVSQSLMSESAQTDNQTSDQAHFLNAFKHLFQLLVPAAAAICILGWFVLRAYGPSYAANGFLPLVILAVSSLFVGINWLGDTWLNIRKRSRAYFQMNAVNAAAVIIGVFVGAPHGLAVATTGYLCGQIFSAAIYLRMFWRNQSFFSRASKPATS